MAKLHTEAMERINRKNTTRSGQKKKYNFWTDAWRRLKRNPTAIIGLCIILFLFALAIFADVIAPYDYITVDYMAANQTPSAANGSASSFKTAAQGGKTAPRAHHQNKPARLSLIYESRDKKLCLFEDTNGHLTAVRSSRLA